MPCPPMILYGTAWKEEETAKLTLAAIENGFTGIDSANYPTSYNEPLTGEGISSALKSGRNRNDLFIQTKFTPVWAHEEGKIPYNPNQSIEGQIRESVQQSLEHLHVEYVDALLLHIYFENDADNLVAWKVFESFVPNKVRKLGVSNFGLSQLQQLYSHASVKPSFVQNRFYKETSFDIDVRAFCTDHGIVYQAYWMLRHNPEVVESELLESVSKRLDVERELAFYILILGMGGTQILNGTTNSERMVRDVKTIEALIGDEASLEALKPDVDKFRELLSNLSKQKQVASV